MEEKLEPRLLTELLKEMKDVKRKLKNREFYWYGRINRRRFKGNKKV